MSTKDKLWLPPLTPKVVAVNGLAYGSPEQIADEILQALKPLCEKYNGDATGMRVVISASMSFAVQSARMLGVSKKHVEEMCRQAWDRSGNQ